jgi:hypothetical protein
MSLFDGQKFPTCLGQLARSIRFWSASVRRREAARPPLAATLGGCRTIGGRRTVTDLNGKRSFPDPAVNLPTHALGRDMSQGSSRQPLCEESAAATSQTVKRYANTLRLRPERAQCHIVERGLVDRANPNKLIHRSTPAWKGSKFVCLSRLTLNQEWRSPDRFASMTAPIRDSVSYIHHILSART